ncbi:MAG TPA: nuclear transport factor 2 family protein [Micromonosporaceae bacterium]
MREKLAVVDLDSARIEGEAVPDIAFIAGHAGYAGCPRCVEELIAAGQDFDRAFAERDYERFISYFVNENATGLGADGTVGMNRDAWGRILREYFDEPTWTLRITPIKTVVQNCVSGQILEVARFDSAEQGSITFVHVTCWVRDHGQWKVALQTEAGPLQDTQALLDKVAAQREEFERP